MEVKRTRAGPKRFVMNPEKKIDEDPEEKQCRHEKTKTSRGKPSGENMMTEDVSSGVKSHQKN